MHGPKSTRSRLMARRAIAGLLAGIMVAAPTVLSAGPASAAVFDPGDITFTLTGGSIKLNTGTTDPLVTPYEVDLAGDPANPGDPITLSGTIAEDGALSIPKAGVVFPPATIEQSGLTVGVRITAVNDVAGQIDPESGAASAPLTLAVELTPTAGNTCTLTVPLQLSTDKPGGQALAAGVVKLADSGFSVPVTTKSGPVAPTLCGIIDNVLGLPAPAVGGTNSTVMTLTTDAVEPPPTTTPTTAPPTSAPTTAPPTTAPPTPPTTAAPAPPVTESSYLPAKSIRPTYTCSGADEATSGLLTALGGGTLALAPELRMGLISPSPEQGSTFNPSFGLALTLDPDLVASVIALGVTEARVSDMRLEITPHTGVEGAPLIAEPPAQTVKLVAGQAAVLEAGPFSAPFTRTSAIGEPVGFAAGPVTMTLTASLGGAPIGLNLACAASGETTLIVTDVKGTPTPAEVAGETTSRASRTSLPRTGSDNLELSLLAALLFGLGLAAANEAVLRRRRFHG